jgi:SAM-dependent methyltransferase
MGFDLATQGDRALNAEKTACGAGQMTENAKHDAWNAGDSYDAYMGRWSKKLAVQFLDWLNVDHGLDWLDVGSGTGALSSAVLSQCNPRSLIGIEQSAGFVATARTNISDARARFELGDAQNLPLDDHSRDIVASALLLNFVPDIPKALSEMKRVVRPSGSVAFYVWDYPGGGMGFMRAFWTAAISLDPSAAGFAEGKRFPFCTPAGLAELVSNAGLRPVDVSAIEIPTIFRNFDDFWQPFTLGAGPAPGYCVSLTVEAREKLRVKLSAELPRGPTGTIALNARAWALKARAG